MSDRIVTIRVPIEADTVAFQIEFSPDLLIWTGFDPVNPAPSAAADLPVELLEDGGYRLDGVNPPYNGNEQAAAQLGNHYRVRLKNLAGYGNWSASFRVADYPSGADLAEVLAAAGFSTTPSPELCEDAVRAATAAFEGATGRKVLAGDADETRYFDPPETRDGLLSLGMAGEGGELFSLTSVVFQPAGAAARVLTAGVDYVPEPGNAPAVGKAYTQLRFRHWSYYPSAFSYYRSIQVTGKWGMGTEVPADIRQAILSYAALSLFAVNRYAATGGVLSWKEDDVSEDYGVEVSKAVIEGWQRVWADALRRYRKWELA